jgi:hypothetical protein
MRTEIEELLYEEECSTLDFKKEQYLFNKSTDNQKSELLKDILAFANAWKRADAFILIGVEDVRGGKSNVVGVNEDLDDACLQQFVNSKTQRPITFEYKSAIIEEKRIGVIRIPVQARPIYLKNDFGRLKANVVYIRRGSSTAEADPDEIARMGIAFPEIYRTQPQLQVEFARHKERVRLGTELNVDTIKLLVPEQNAIPDYEETRTTSLMPIFGSINRNFYREMVDYYYWKYICKSFTFYIENVSELPALGIKIVMDIPKSDGFGFLRKSQMPDEPHSSLDISSRNIGSLSNNVFTKSDFVISETLNNWIIEIEIPRLQPKSSYFTQNKIFVYSERDTAIDFSLTIYSDNLTTPIKSKLILRTRVTEKPGDLKTIKKMHYQLMREQCETKRI